MSERNEESLNLGAAIRRAREALEMSQKALAERAGFPAPQSISEIELGNRDVKAHELVRLAQVLHTDVDVLLGISSPPPRLRVLWRRETKGEHKAREAQLLERARRYAQLEAWCGVEPAATLPDVPFDPRRASFEDVAAIAEQMRRLLDLGSIPAASLLTTLEETYGVKVFYDRLVQTEDGDCSAACVRGAFGAAILMDATEAPWRRNFNLAHEVFHLLTWSAVQRVWVENTPHGEEPVWYARVEQLANHFAAQLLLPADTVLYRFNARIRDGKISYADLVQLAREFHVSSAALLIRLKTLGRLSADQADQLRGDPVFRKLDRDTMRGRWEEPPVPFTARYRELAHLAYGRGIIGVAKLAEYLEEAVTMVDLPDEGLADAPEAALTLT